MEQEIRVTPEAWHQFEKLVSDAVEGGHTQEMFAKAFHAHAIKFGWDSWIPAKKSSDFTRWSNTILRTITRKDYMQNRLEQLRQGNFRFWVYRTSSIDCESQHSELDGLVLPRNHRFWQHYFPANHWACACRAFGARNEASARRKGGDIDKKLPKWVFQTNPNTQTFIGIDPLFDGFNAPNLEQIFDALLNGTISPT